MKKKLTALALVLAVVASLFAGMTLTYFTDKGTVTNTFTVGNVDIKVYETDANGQETEEGRLYENVVPGVSYDKNPTIKNIGSNPAYARMLVTVPMEVYAAIVGTNLTDVFENLSSNFTHVDTYGNTEQTAVTYVFNYNGELAAGESATLFTSFKLPTTVTQMVLASLNGNFNIVVEGQAIQSEGLTQAEALAALGNAYGVDRTEIVMVAPGSIPTSFTNNTTYLFTTGEYPSFSLYLRRAENVNIIASNGVTVNGNMTVGYHSGQDGGNPLKTNSTLTVKGFTVDGTLAVASADQKVVVAGNTAKDIKVPTWKIDNMTIQILNNTVVGGGYKYGIYVVPEATNYDLTVDGNTISGVTSHAVAVQGNGQGGAKKTANSITVTNNTFNSYGAGKAAFKIWEDTKYAPDNTALTSDARTLITSILNGGNRFNAGANHYVYDFYGIQGNTVD